MLDLRDTVANLEARVNLLRPRARMDASWEAVSEEVASEISRLSETLNERMASEVERAIQTHSNPSPATSSEQRRIVQEDLQTEYEAALRQLEQYPPEIRLLNDNIREERWTQFSLEGAKFPTTTVDVIQRGEALATFERHLIIHF